MVTILSDPDGYEICFVGDVGFYDLATPLYDKVWLYSLPCRQLVTSPPCCFAATLPALLLSTSPSLHLHPSHLSQCLRLRLSTSPLRNPSPLNLFLCYENQSCRFRSTGVCVPAAAVTVLHLRSLPRSTSRSRQDPIATNIVPTSHPFLHSHASRFIPVHLVRPPWHLPTCYNPV